MSLLLDALKKAADDKKKASQGEPSRMDTDAQQQGVSPDKITGSELTLSEPEAAGNILKETGLQETALPGTDLPGMDLSENGFQETAPQAEDSGNQAEAVTDPIDGLSLDLEEIDIAEDALTIEAIDNDGVEADSRPAVSSAAEDRPDTRPDSLQQMPHKTPQKTAFDENDGEATPRSYQLSDDALSMLIHKTNREVKRSNRVILFATLMVCLIILIGGGVYYYLDMQAEIASLERKHQIAMQSMRVKTSNEKTPEKSAIIRSLVGESDLVDKVEYAKKQMADEKNARRVERKMVNREVVAGASGKAVAYGADSQSLNAGTLSIERTHKKDPVADKLDAAWLAYEGAHYAEASKLYKEVLLLEKNNRDAYLGLGAIAIIEKDNEQARRVYLSLLELDPRDPIATAAISSLHSDDASLETDEKYLLSMLQKNPQVSHLYFALGNIYSRQSKWKAAQQAYFSAWQADNDNADYLFNLAVSLDQLGKKEQALRFYKDCLLSAENKQISFSRDAARNRINELSGL